MVGKIVHSNGVVQVDWSTHNKKIIEKRFEETLFEIQTELEKQFKVGVKVIPVESYYPVGFESEEVAKKFSNILKKHGSDHTEQEVRYDPKNQHFVTRTLDESTLLEFFNSKQGEFIVTGTERIPSFIMATSLDVNFHNDKDWKEELRKNKPILVYVTLSEKQDTVLKNKNINISVPCGVLQIKTD